MSRRPRRSVSPFPRRIMTAPMPAPGSDCRCRTSQDNFSWFTRKSPQELGISPLDYAEVRGGDVLRLIEGATRAMQQPDEEAVFQTARKMAHFGNGNGRPA